VDPFLAWIQDVSMAAWDLGQEFSCDEQISKETIKTSNGLATSEKVMDS
jgi:hypothetical protein